MISLLVLTVTWILPRHELHAFSQTARRPPVVATAFGRSTTSSPRDGDDDHRRCGTATRRSVASFPIESVDVGEVDVGDRESDRVDGPVVLLGCSGRGDELRRLASSLAARDGGRAVEAHRFNVARMLREVTTPRDVDAMMARGELGYRDVLVLDLADETLDAEAVGRLDALAAHLRDRCGCACVYVNVHPEAGEATEHARRTREEWEERLFLARTDHEIALRDEGLSGDDADAAWRDVEWELARVAARAALPRPIPGADDDDNDSCNDPRLALGGRNTFFLSLSFPDLADAEPYLPELCRDADAMEFRADLLDCRDDRHALLHALFRLRAACRPHATRAPATPFRGGVIDDALPVVYTVRTAGQAGTFPDQRPEDVRKMFELLHLGARSGCEVLDVESAWDPALTDALLRDVEDRRRSCLVLGSHHAVPDPSTFEEAVGYYRACALDGRAHGTKVVLSPGGGDDAFARDAAVEADRRAVADGGPRVAPYVALVLGEEGSGSRALNLGFTPVTHPALPFAAAPGQLDAAEIMERRVRDGLVTKTRYAILGHNIAYSVSPQMQGAAFRATGLPHEYGRADHETVEEFVAGGLWNADDFGGCSVTIPHKQSIMPYVDVLTDAAEAVGSVNTVTVEKRDDGSRVVHGDNTDWRGIHDPLRRRLRGRFSSGGGVALILGGGGTARAAAYAAARLGLDRVYWNRTTRKARDLAESFGGTVVESLDAPDDGATTSSLGNHLRSLVDDSSSSTSSLRVVVSTLPAGAAFELPEWILRDVEEQKKNKGGDDGPVVFDVNYKPYHTKLLLQAEARGLDVVRGSEMLWEQGVGQFEIWTGRTAPYKVMKDAVLENCLPEQ